jgi:hypothetical protein
MAGIGRYDPLEKLDFIYGSFGIPRGRFDDLKSHMTVHPSDVSAI